MVSYLGKYNAFINSLAGNQVDFMRERIPSALMKVYADVFKPYMASMFPAMSAPSVQGQVIGAKQQFSEPYSADLGMMAPFIDRIDELDEYIPAFGEIHYQTRIVGFAGPTIDRMEFKNSYVDGFLDMRNQIQLAEVSRAFKRREEMELVNFAHGNEASIGFFSNDLTDVALKRLLKLDLPSGKITTNGYGDAAPVLEGVTWDQDTGKPIKDITTIQMMMGEMTDTSPGIMGFVGNKTAWILDNSAELQQVQQYHVDVSQSVIGTSIKGVSFTRITGQFYKDDSSVNAGMLHNPGLGSPKPDTWVDRNKVQMMRYTADTKADPYDVDTGTTATYEWALFVIDDVIGSRRYARVFDDHQDPLAPFVHSYEDAKSRTTKTNIYEAFTPTVNDFGRMVVLDRVAQV